MTRFGRRKSRDDRDHGFLLHRLLPEKLALPSRKTWPIAPRALDQGETGTCVGHAWRGFLRCGPIRTEKTGPSAWDLYRTAVLLDNFPENDGEARLPDGDPGLESGTSVRAGAKAVTKLGRLASYAWAFSLQPAVEWVLSSGPLVLGTDWYHSMMNTDAEGIVRIAPGSTIAGGHAYLCRGIDTKRALARCCNSWGDGWGISGDFWIPLKDLEQLIAQDGEACTAVEKKP